MTNVYVSNNITLRYLKHVLSNLKEIDKSKIILGDFNKCLSVTNKTLRKNTCNNIQVISNIINKFDLLNKNRTSHRRMKKYILFSSTHKTFTKIYHLLDYK